MDVECKVIPIKGFGGGHAHRVQLYFPSEDFKLERDFGNKKNIDRWKKFICDTIRLNSKWRECIHEINNKFEDYRGY